MAKRERRVIKVGRGRELDFVEARARRSLREGKAEEAALELERALKSGDEPRLRQLLGRCYLEMGRLHEAMAAFSKVLEESPFSSGALLGLAQALERDGRRVKALQIYRRFLSSNPGGEEALEVKRRVGAIEEELSQQQQSRLLSPEQIERVEELLSDARFYLEVGQTRRARAEAEEVLKIDPKNAKAHLIAAQALVEEGEVEKARQHLKEALEARPGNDEEVQRLTEKIGV